MIPEGRDGGVSLPVLGGDGGLTIMRRVVVGHGGECGEPARPAPDRPVALVALYALTLCPACGQVLGGNGSCARCLVDHIERCSHGAACEVAAHIRKTDAVRRALLEVARRGREDRREDQSPPPPSEEVGR